MNPAVHVLIECFLYGLEFAPPTPSGAPMSHRPRPRFAPSSPRLLFVKQLTDG